MKLQHAPCVGSARSQVIFSSEVYANKANAERGAAGLRANIGKAAPTRVPRAFVRKSSKPHAKAQPWYFVVAAANYEKQGKVSPSVRRFS